MSDTISDFYSSIIMDHNIADNTFSYPLPKLIPGLTDIDVLMPQHTFRLSECKVMKCSVDMPKKMNSLKIKFDPNHTVNIQPCLKLATPVTPSYVYDTTIQRNNLFDELCTFMRQHMDQVNRLTIKHFYNDRTNFRHHMTHFTIPPSAFINMLLNHPYPNIAFLNKIKRISDNRFQIDIFDDIFFKDNLFMYCTNRNDRLFYYPKYIDIKFENGQFKMFCHPSNTQIGDNDIIKIMAKLIIEICGRMVANGNTTHNEITHQSIIDYFELNLSGNSNRRGSSGIFQNKLCQNINEIMNEIDIKDYLFMRPGTTFP